MSVTIEKQSNGLVRIQSIDAVLSSMHTSSAFIYYYLIERQASIIRQRSHYTSETRKLLETHFSLREKQYQHYGSHYEHQRSELTVNQLYLRRLLRSHVRNKSDEQKVPLTSHSSQLCVGHSKSGALSQRPRRDCIRCFEVVGPRSGSIWRRVDARSSADLKPHEKQLTTLTRFTGSTSKSKHSLRFRGQLNKSSIRTLLLCSTYV